VRPDGNPRAAARGEFKDWMRDRHQAPPSEVVF